MPDENQPQAADEVISTDDVAIIERGRPDTVRRELQQGRIPGTRQTARRTLTCRAVPSRHICCRDKMRLSAIGEHRLC